MDTRRRLDQLEASIGETEASAASLPSVTRRAVLRTMAEDGVGVDLCRTAAMLAYVDPTLPRQLSLEKGLSDDEREVVGDIDISTVAGCREAAEKLDAAARKRQQQLVADRFGADVAVRFWGRQA